MSKMAQEKTSPDSKITQYVSNVDRDVYTVSNIPDKPSQFSYDAEVDASMPRLL